MAEGQHPLPEQVPINTPYVASLPQIVDIMLKLAKVGSSDNNPARIEEARVNARNAGVADRVNFELNDLFDADIRRATVVAVYLLPEVNLRLRPRLMQELRPGTRVVSHSFSMGDWKPDKELLVNGDHVYLWTVPDRTRLSE
jgi:hypothetical protein